MKFGAGGKHVKGPIWDLLRVKELVQSGCFYLMRTSAFDRIAETLGIDDRREISAVARDGVLALDEGGVVMAADKTTDDEQKRGEPEEKSDA